MYNDKTLTTNFEFGREVSSLVKGVEITSKSSLRLFWHSLIGLKKVSFAVLGLLFEGPVLRRKVGPYSSEQIPSRDPAAVYGHFTHPPSNFV
jgi:hypothetical protein